VATNGLQTGYVATRFVHVCRDASRRSAVRVCFSWWRAPEVFINWERYDEKVDIWSTGCIMAELILLKPLFAGTDHIDQLTKIFDVVGTPLQKTLDEVCEPCECVHTATAGLHATRLVDARDYIGKLPIKPKQDYEQLFGHKYDQSGRTIVSGVSPQGIGLLDRLLSFDHRTRPTAEEALGESTGALPTSCHRLVAVVGDAYFENLHDPMEEPSAEKLTDEHQDAAYSTQQWKCE
jgi:serine/threonine protein kinase